MITNDLLEEAKTLANSHRKIDPETTDIFVIPNKNSRKKKKINLLEVSSVVPTSGCVFPISFNAANGMKYPCSIIVVDQKDFDKIKAKKIRLPEDWGDISDSESV